MPGIIASLGLVGVVLFLAGPGGWSKLGGAFAGSFLLAVLLVPVAGPMEFALAAPVMGAALGLLPPFDRETAPRAHITWLVCVLLAMTGLVLWFTGGNSDLVVLALVVFGPGALAAAGRLLYFLHAGDE
ncbi:hypothetical protein [Streptomyces sp. AN091965]|uniref:hypothetical protein n=1 Tax=Streptomyces sp. AN091965 TaxID=2927803 RepID=UPI001F605F4B|nr:hypothetical protein [Streptomyces sp. AN091965]MCI3927852.1 hypothetical protein [Streptomyces sp. AN091965]